MKLFLVLQISFTCLYVSPTMAWQCGSDRIERQVIGQECGSTDGSKNYVNSCCVDHDRCIDESLGKDHCDRTFCSCLRSIRNSDCYNNVYNLCSIVRSFGDPGYRSKNLKISSHRNNYENSFATYNANQFDYDGGYSTRERSIVINGNTFNGNINNLNQGSCNDGACRICIDGKCFGRNYHRIKFSGNNCPVAACDYNCNEFVMWNGCVYCQCPGGVATREPCEVQSDCSSGAICQNNLCRYTNLPANLPRACDFDFECRSTDTCSRYQCQPGADVNHVEGVSCVFDHQCPSGTRCRRMTCYDSPGSGHQEGVSCVFDHQCRSGYSCENLSCVYTGRSHSSVRCTFDSQCSSRERCVSMTCTQRW